MHLLIGSIFVAVLILLMLQIKTLKNDWDKHRKSDREGNLDLNRYPDNVNEVGKRAMDDIKKGIVKKQLLSNDALKHDSNKMLTQYRRFINDSSVYKYLISAKEWKYNGED